MTHNNSHIFISDGSSFIYVVDENITILERIKVYDQNGKELIYINELEWFQDSNGKQYIYANVYTKNVLVKIDCDTHRVVNTYNLYQLTKKAKERTNLKHD
jgi:glutamine cyclotransferase